MSQSQVSVEDIEDLYATLSAYNLIFKVLLRANPDAAKTLAAFANSMDPEDVEVSYRSFKITRETIEDLVAR